MSWAQKAIVGSVDKEWISKIRNKHVGLNHLMPSDLLAHPKQYRNIQVGITRAVHKQANYQPNKSTNKSTNKHTNKKAHQQPNTITD
jgi:hypothetical protein